MKKKLLAGVLTLILAVQPAALCGAEEFTAEEALNVQENSQENVQQDMESVGEFSEDEVAQSDNTENSDNEIEDVQDEAVSAEDASEDQVQDVTDDSFEITEEEFTDQADTDVFSAGDSGETKTYTLTGTITAQLSQGVMTITGSGEMPDYEDDTQQPWYSEETKIKKLVISDGITKVGNSNFWCCAIEEISFPETLTVIGRNAFYSCYRLKTINLPESLVTIEDGAFCACERASGVRMGKNVKSIGNAAFLGVDVKQITLPASLESINTQSFNNTTLEDYILDAGNPYYKVIDGVLFSADGKKLLSVPVGKNTDTYQIPDGVEIIGDSSFVGVKNIKQVSIPASVTTVESWVFQDSSLESLVIPDTVTQIGYGIAMGSKSLRTAVIGNGITELPYKTFEECTSLVSISLGNNIKVIDSRACLDCTSLTSISLPEGLETINGNSFYGCTALRQINIPSTVKTIESRAFAECSPELVVNLPSGLVQTDDGSYRRTSNLSFTGTYKYSRAYEILNYTNQERAKVGAAPLTMDPDLLAAAMKRASECSVKYDHTRPTGSAWNTASTVVTAWGENILSATSYLDAAGDVQMWMNSEMHKWNILNTDYTSIGVGCFEQNEHFYCVQLFGKTTPGSFAAPGDYTTKVTIPVLAEDYTIKELVWYDQTITAWTQTVSVGDTQKMAPVIAESNASRTVTELDPEDFQWSSSNPAVASVDAQGNVRGISAGRAQITATTTMMGGFTVTAPVRIKVGEVNFWDTIDGEGDNPFGNNDKNNENNSNNNTSNSGSNSSSSSKIKLNRSSMTLYKGKNAVLKASGTKGKITWKSSNSRVAAVNQKGKVTAKKKGTAVITASLSNGNKAVCKVTVKEIPVKRIKLNVKDLRAYKGYKFTVKTTLTPKKATDTITWKSSNPKVASVTSKGVIRMKKNGKATITARTKSGKKATVKVTVWSKKKVYKK